MLWFCSQVLSIPHPQAIAGLLSPPIVLLFPEVNVTGVRESVVLDLASFTWDNASAIHASRGVYRSFAPVHC